jgi:NAD-dependent SIR2 family protein deacetylase
MGTVYFLGAGASAAAALPERRVLTQDFLQRAFEMVQDDPRLEHVRAFVEDFFQYDPEKGILPTAEEVLSAVDLALERSEALSTEYTQGYLQDIRRHFAFLIYLVLEDAYRDLGSRVTDRFVRKLGDAPTVISLNYDIIIDWALCKRFWPDQYDWVELDYGIDYRVYLPGGQRPSLEFVQPGPVKLFKIHGSLNWALCPTCGVVYVGPPLLGKSVRDTFAEGHPARCAERNHAPLEPLLITPTYLKSYARPQLSLIWHRAESALRRAGEVVFVGYSMPEADYHIKYLLQKALYRNPRPKITVVDYKEPDPEQQTLEEKRYTRLFGPAFAYDTRGFEHYVGNVMEG